MSKNALLILALFILGAVAGRSACPKIVERGRVIPQIITVHDTTKVPFKVIVDRVTTDTYNLVIHQTIHDTVVIHVPGLERDSVPVSRIWPVLAYRTLNRQKDTAELRTFDLRTGRGASSIIYAPGPLISIIADSSPTPRLGYGEWPKAKTSTVKTIFHFGLGYAACTLSNYVSH